MEISGKQLSPELIDALLGAPVYGEADIIAKYPARALPVDAMVTRVGPSPTGFMHIGGLYAALISERFAHQSGGVFILRIEDTDKAREVEGALETIIKSLNEYGIEYDEGPTLNENEKGSYGPYRQSERTDIYKPFIRRLLETGQAYPCFCTSEELEAARAEQEANKIKPGYYGQWAVWRDAPLEKINEAITAGKKAVIRLRSAGNPEATVLINDVLKGDKEISANDQDIVLLKSDGTPTYHFAHVIDDHFMGTTHVLRGDEWFISTPMHLEIFAALGWTAPIYGHLAPIMKLDGSSRRKLSKRKDPEANIEFYGSAGYPKEAVIEYLLNLADSSFEAWRDENSDKDYRDFNISFERLAGGGGALIDLQKLNDISKNVIARFNPEETWNRIVAWASVHSPAFAVELASQKEYSMTFLSIEKDNEKRRKDIAVWAEVETKFGFFFDSFDEKPLDMTLLEGLDKADVVRAANLFIERYDTADDREAWFDKLKTIALELGYAETMKELKNDTDKKFKGYVGDIAKIFRVFLTGSTNSPDLHEVMFIMGSERALGRIERGTKLFA